ncbi:MAG: exodeoxyribonuclease V subunit gamma, partial [Propionibacteriaceae bacterium]|nr:exodeoxyribonuclease V subunit gamma [Propionibacteriaceae bacterium]
IRQLAAELASQLDQLASPDPFIADLVICPNAALQRWLGQSLATRLGASRTGQPILAGVNLTNSEALLARCLPDAAIWQSSFLTLTLLDLVDQLNQSTDLPYLFPHWEPQARPSRRWTIAQFCASWFHHQWYWNSGLLARWRNLDLPANRLCAPSDQPWLADLWPLLDQRLGQPRLWRDQDDQLLPFEDQPLINLKLLEQSWHWFAMTGWSDPLSQIASRCAKLASGWIWRMPAHQLPVAPSNPAAAPPAIVSDQAAGAIPVLKSAPEPVLESQAIWPDQAIGCLSNRLIGLFNDDPNLEAGDIVVVIDDFDHWHPNLAAAFWNDDQVGASDAHRLRVQLQPETAMVESLGLFDHLFALLGDRATVGQLIDLLNWPELVNHFQLDPSDLNRLEQLLPDAGIRWGVNAESRTAWQMSSFPQNTWFAGLGRLAAGLALRQSDWVWQGSTTPIDLGDNSAIRLVSIIGTVAQQCRQIIHSWRTAVTPQQWSQRLTEVADGLTGGLGPDLHDLINDLKTHPATPLSWIELRMLLRQLRIDRQRPPLGSNGALAMVAAGQMSQVPYPIVIRLTNPASSVAASTRPGPIATTRLITLELIGPCYVAKAGSTEDRLGGATADGGPDSHAQPANRHRPAACSQPRPKINWDDPRADTSTDMSLARLIASLTNPAAEWLNRVTGISASSLSPRAPLRRTIPDRLVGLDRWRIVDQLLQGLQAGVSPQRLEAVLLRQGDLPPGLAGQRALLDCQAQAVGIHQRSLGWRQQAPDWQTITLPATTTVLFGDQFELPELDATIVLHGANLASVQAGRVRIQHQLRLWCQLVVGVAAGLPLRQAVLVGPDKPLILRAPTADQAVLIANQLRALAQCQLVEPLPLPPVPAASWQAWRSINDATMKKRLSSSLDRYWAQDPTWSLLWPQWTALMAIPSHCPDTHQLTTDSTMVDSASEPSVLNSWPAPCRFTELAAMVYQPLLDFGGQAL